MLRLNIYTYNEDEGYWKFDKEKWGEALVNTLASQIGDEAAEPLKNGTPLYAFKDFQEIFPSETSPDRTITITKDGVSKDITISATDSMNTIAQKIDKVTGSTTDVNLFTDRDEDNEKGVILATNITSSSGVKFSGDRDLLNILGFRSNLEQSFSLNSSAIKNKDIHFRNFYLNSSTGEVHDSDITLTTNNQEFPEYDLLTDFEAAYIGQVPKHDVQLKDINNFWNSQGIFMMDQPQKIIITQGDGKTASVTLYKTDTLEDVRRKLNDAIADDLGQSRHVNAKNFVSFVNEKQAQGSETVAGTFVIRSAIPEKSGELNFSGDEDLLRALGLNTIQEATESEYTLLGVNLNSREKATRSIGIIT